MFSFNKLLIPLAFVGLFAFSSCERDEDMALPSETGTELTVRETYTAAHQVVIQAINDADVRDYIYHRAADRMTHDYEIVYGMVKNELLSNGQSLESAMMAAERELIASGELSAPVVHTFAEKAPLLSINVPHGLAKWNTAEFTPPVAFDVEASVVNGQFPATYTDGSIQQIDIANLPDYPIITVERNERMIYFENEYTLDPGLIMAIAPKIGDENAKLIECFYMNGEEVCDDPRDGGGFGGGGGGGGHDDDDDDDDDDTSGGDPCATGWNMTQYLTGIRMENIGSFEPIGRPELRLRIFGGDNNIWAGDGPTGTLIVDPIWNPSRRSVRRRWWNINHRILRWYDDYGSILTYRWEEEDSPLFGGGGDMINFNINLQFGGQDYGANVSFPRGNGDDYIGTTIVDKDECARQYSVGALQFRLRF